MDTIDRPLRSALFILPGIPVPAEVADEDQPDIVIWDLEDTVAPADKEHARGRVRLALRSNVYRGRRCVRVNGLGTGLTPIDLESVVCNRLDFVMLPKVESKRDVEIGWDLLGRAAAITGLEKDRIRLLPIVETAMGLTRVEEIATGPGIATLVFGTFDFSVDVGLDPTNDAREFFYARSRVVVAARAGQLMRPIDGAFVGDFKDRAAVEADSRLSRQLGFQGRCSGHLPQIRDLNRYYGEVSVQEEMRARRMVAAFEQAQAEGRSLAIVDGRFVDMPIYRHARRTVALAELMATGRAN